MPLPSIRQLRSRWPASVLLLTGLLVILAQPGAPPPAVAGSPPPVQALGAPRISSAGDATAARIAPALRQAVAASTQPDTLLPVIVVSQGAPPAGVLHNALSRRPDAHGLVFTSGRAAAGQVGALARPANVIAVLSGAPPTLPVPNELPGMHGGRPDHAHIQNPARAGQPPAPNLAPNSSPIQNPKSKIQNPAVQNPDSWHTVDIQDVRPAWQAGYRGGGVKVAVIDSGVDFGHPDLQNTFARVEDPHSPYYGWPLAYDPTSMELLANGITGDINNAIQAYGSWYIDTSATIHGETGSFQTVTATGNGMNPIVHTYHMPGTSKSGIYHIGIFPDEHLSFDVYGEYPVVVLADTQQPGVYDTVYVDLRNSRDLRTAIVLRKGHEVGGLDVNGDGVPDYSTGMLYFIADGQHAVPGSDWLYGLPAPDNGTLVAMMGSYDYDEHHGTACASSIVAQGVIDGPNGGLRPPFKPPGIGGMVQGMAPDAKLIAVGNVYRGGMAIYDAYALVTYGLDGRGGTTDAPQIASMSYGFDGGVDNGWDFQSRYLAALQQDNPQLSYVVAMGNGGPGYGSQTAPATAANVIPVGAATQYAETTVFDPISSTLDITWGDIQPWSDRGPSILGNAGPAVVAVGAWGTADDALNYSRDGVNAYDIWGGTSMATPVTAGVLALGYQAYRQATGHWPDAGTARELLTSSARDLNYGSFSQGAGLVDGLRLVNLAAGTSGIQVSPMRWAPGQSAPAFAGYVRPGDTASTTLTLTNPTGSPVNATVGGDQLLEVGHYDWTLTTSNTLESGSSFTRPDYLQDLTGVIPANTDLMRVQAVFSYTEFTQSAPNSPWLYWNNTWRLLAYDWQDKNGDGRLWIDKNGNGVVNDGEIQTGEFNRLWYSYPKGAMMEGFINKPLSRVHDGLWIGLQHADGTGAIPSTHIRLRATFYRHSPWPLLSTDRSSVVVPPHGSASLVATVQVPAGQPAGAYEAAIRVSTGSGVIVVPVALNVALPTLLGSFGGTPPQPTTYDNGRMAGDLNWAWRADAGEWRHFFAFNDTTPPPNSYLWVNTTWPHYPSDIDTFLLGAAPWDYFSVSDPALFGPYDLWGMGGSAYNYEGGGEWQWGTNTNTTAEWVSGGLSQPGLHEVVLHNVWYSGADFSEPFTGTLGPVQLSQDHIEIDSNNTQDSTTISFTTGLTLATGLVTSGYGLSQRSVLHDLPIQAQGTYFYDLAVTNTASIEFSTSSPHAIDLYLYIDYFDGQRWNWIAASGGGGPFQYVRIEPAHDGAYRVRVDGGLNIPDGGSTFDLTIKAVRGGDVAVTPARVPGPILPGTTLTFTVGYNRPGMPPGIYDGHVFLGPPEAPALASLPMQVVYGNPTPEPTLTPWPCVPDIRDLSQDNWAWPYVSYLYCQGVVSGYLDRTFHPGDKTSRVQFLAMLGRAQNWALVTPATPTFNDVPPTFWGYGYIETAAHYGIADGYADGGFHPVAPVTRAQVAKFIVRATNWSATPTPVVLPHFRDVAPSDWAYPYVMQAATHGLISGYADGTFQPNSDATRAQMAKILYNLLQVGSGQRAVGSGQ
ncbi:MAG TPA: S-layer homology domain-containing protein [Chloroflexia bacterium]|nr:S-layer homology domain-containing protein [Chloroflexia bacterium]